jgi:hypothetical protein
MEAEAEPVVSLQPSAVIRRPCTSVLTLSPPELAPFHNPNPGLNGWKSEAARVAKKTAPTGVSIGMPVGCYVRAVWNLVSRGCSHRKPSRRCSG